MLHKMSQNRKSATQETFAVFIIKEQRFQSHSKLIRRKNRDATKEVSESCLDDTINEDQN